MGPNGQRRGLNKVFPASDSDNTTVDIIAIHGLDTESPRTWTYKKGGRSVNWLKDSDMLPAAVPDARIYTYDWNAKVFDNAPVQTLLGHADNLLSLVAAEHGTSSRPLLFVASCFGGLVLAEATCRAAQAGSKYRQILQSTIGIVFLATPFAGTDAAGSASWLVVVNGIMGKDASPQLIKDLEERNSHISELVQKFAEIANNNSTRFPIYCFYETGKTKIAKKILPSGISDKWLRGSILVTQSSACLHGFERRGLGKPHVMMNKFEGNNCPDFIHVREAIQFLLKEGPNTLKRRERREVTQGITQRPIESDMQAATEEQRIRLLKSLRFPSMNERKNDLADSYGGTFRWILRTNDTPIDKPDDLKDKPWYNFEDWLKSDNTIYWISGKPASGKSTLVKYLIENPLVKEALAIWVKGTNDPMILSHFFWKAGTEKLQRNIKGCLCSLLHQAIQPDTVPLNSILATYKSILTKESVTDWSRKELENVCFAVLRNYPSSICIFLDGLDEICLEDRRSLVKLIETLREFPNIKICVSSRPELCFQEALDEYPHLRLQDLTLSDMEEYASAQIQPYISDGQISTTFGSKIINSLLIKAEGVFLWLRLASNSLVRGLNNKDSEKILYQRLEEMPNDLYDLYNDMWIRINEDTRLYRETAARYFNVVIALQKSTFKIPLLRLMAIMNDEVQDIFISKRNNMDATSLQHECDKTIREVQHRCIGILEIVPEDYNLDKIRNPTDKPLLHYWNMRPHFLHRTAYDFLTDTEYGRQILTHDSSSQHELSLRIIKGDLIALKLVDSQDYANLPIVDLTQLTDTISQTAINEILNAMWDCYENGYYDNRYYSIYSDTSYHNPIRRACFLAVTAHVATKEFILSSIANSSNPSSLATDVLRYICEGQSIRFNGAPYFLEPLLALNADPSAKGIYLPLRVRCFPEMKFRSPIAGYMTETLKIDIMGKNSQETDTRYRELQRFIEAGADPQERISLFIGITYEKLTILKYPLSATLVLDLAILVRACSERARKKGFPSSTDKTPYQSPRDASENTSPRLALIITYESNSITKHYQCTRNEATERLVAFLIEFLCGDDSQDLAQKAYRERNKIINDISNGSIKYEKLDKKPEEFLAEHNLGYCFTDPRTKAPIPRDAYEPGRAVEEHRKLWRQFGTQRKVR